MREKERLRVRLTPVLTSHVPQDGQPKTRKKMPSAAQSRVFQKDLKKLQLPDSETDSDLEDEKTEEAMDRKEAEAFSREKEMKPVKGMAGVFYKVNLVLCARLGFLTFL